MDWVTVSSVILPIGLLIICTYPLYFSILDMARNESDKYRVPSFSKCVTLLNGNYIVE